MAKGRNSTKSIAKRLNGALTRRRFFRTLLIDIAVAALVLVLWCGVTESYHGGRHSLSSARYFTNVIECLIDNTAALIHGDTQVHVMTVTEPLETHMSESSATDSPSVPDISAGGETDGTSSVTVSDRYERRLPFSGVYYIFAVENPVYSYTDSVAEGYSVSVHYEGNSFGYIAPGRVAVDASPMLTTVSCGFIALLLLQCLYFITVQFTGRGLIRKHLRPIDDLALAAERMSTALRTYEGADTNKESYGVDDGDIDEGDIAQAIDAIDAVDNSCARVEIRESELGGLEAAINNMLRRLDEEKRKQIRFVDDASHELRTPIAVIGGYANMLDRWGKNDPQIMDEAIEAIKAESEHMKTLIDQLLFLARGEMDRHPLEKQPLDAAEIIEDIFDESVMLDAAHDYEIAGAIQASTANDTADNAAGTAENAPAPTPLTVLADLALLKQAIRILRDNAVKYTPEGGQITFKVYERGAASSGGGTPQRSVCIEVSDTGMGIRPEELSRIFDRFYRGSNVRSSSASGSGLGLSIAKWIVEVHGGVIEAISSAGFGSKMTIVLPLYCPEK